MWEIILCWTILNSVVLVILTWYMVKFTWRFEDVHFLLVRILRKEVRNENSKRNKHMR